MAWYWPEIDDASSAEDAVRFAVGASLFIAGVTTLLAVLSLIYQKPVFGLNGWSLVDAGLFAVVAWRIHKMSRAWSIVGLLLYLLEVGERLVSGVGGAVGVLTIVFILGFVGAIRGTFAFHRYRKVEGQLESGVTG